MAVRKKTPKRRRAKSVRRSLKSRKSSIAKTKTTTSRTRKAIVKGSSAAAHHAVRVNPFSQATSQPKIPDGLMHTSLSRRLQSVFELGSGAGSLGGTEMYIVMGPTLGVPLIVGNSELGVLKRNASPVDPSFHGFVGQTVGMTITENNENNESQLGLTAIKTAGKDINFFNAVPFSQWRIVSQGLRLELTNARDEDDGWWEACRFNWRRNLKDITVTPLNGEVSSIADAAYGVAPSQILLDHLIFNVPMIEQPGYKTGLLRDLHKTEFRLHPKTKTHDPVSMERRIYAKEGIDYTVDSADIMEFLETSNNASLLAKSYVDDNMDWIFIKLHCRKNSKGGSQFATNLSQNLEIAFNPESDFASFQTINVADKKTEMVSDAISNDTSAANNRG